MPTSSFSVNTSAPSCYSFCNSRPHEGYPCYDPMGKSNKKILSLHSINKRPSKFRNHIPIIIIASSRSKMSITTGIREDGEDEIPPPSLEPRIISKPKPMALFAEPSPYDYVSGYKYRFQNFIKHLRGIGDEVMVVTTHERARQESHGAQLVKSNRFYLFALIHIISFESMKGAGQWLTIGLVSAWYISNIGVLLLNRYLLSSYGFKYPIFLTTCHMTACSLLSYVTIVWMKIVPLQKIRSRVQFLKISALSLVFCTSVVGGNVSLRYLPVSFNQAIGSTAPFFTAVFAYLLTAKRETWLTYAALIPVVTGVIIASGSEPSFHLFGFIICICATTARALKSVLQGILLSSEGEKLNSMNLLLYMAPMAVTVLLPATLLMEYNVVGSTLALARNNSEIIWYILFNSTMAYFVNLANFLVTKYTSALTLQVMGSAKGAVAVVVSILIFRNPISVTGMMGYMLTVFGVVLYTETKKRSK